MSPDDRFLYLIIGSSLRIVERTSGALVRTVELGGIVRRIAMAADGTAIITNHGFDTGWVDFVR